MSETTATATEAATEEVSGDSSQEQAKTFTQAEVDDLLGKIRGEERRKASEKYADYEDLKAKASQALTAEERIAALEKENAEAKYAALRARVQAAHKISDEDAQLFLTGADEAALTAQAKRLAERASDGTRKRNHAPREGDNPEPPSNGEAAFMRNLLNSGA